MEKTYLFLFANIGITLQQTTCWFLKAREDMTNICCLLTFFL